MKEAGRQKEVLFLFKYANTERNKALGQTRIAAIYKARTVRIPRIYIIIYTRGRYQNLQNILTTCSFHTARYTEKNRTKRWRGQSNLF